MNNDIVIGKGVVPYHLGAWRLPGGGSTTNLKLAKKVAGNINRIIRASGLQSLALSNE